MAIQKKSLISALKAAKKANIASAKPPVGEEVTPEAVSTKNLRSMKHMRSLRSAKSLRSMRNLKSPS